MEAESGAQNEEARIDESTQTSLDELEDDVPDFDENDPSFRDFQNLVDFSAVSKHQKWIILLRTQGLSYRQICDNWKSHVGSLLSKEALINCIHRFAKSLYWEKGTKGGSDGYLCKQDMETLKIDVKEKAVVYSNGDFRANFFFLGFLGVFCPCGSTFLKTLHFLDILALKPYPKKLS